MRIVIATVQDLYTQGGAEYLVSNLQQALRTEKHEVEVVRLPFVWGSHDELLRQAYQWRLMDLNHTGAELVITTKFPSFYVRAQRKVAWIFHQHRPLYDAFGNADFSHFAPSNKEDVALKKTITAWDTAYLSESEQLFTISKTVSQRLKRFNGLDSTPLFHPPPSAESLRPGPYGDYILLPSRLVANKRPWLLIDALAKCTTPVRGILIGKGDLREELLQRAAALGIADRLELRGFVSEEERIELFANARAVFYPPFDEDLGYVTHEAFLAHKPIITMSDSGGPLEFIEHGRSGIIASTVEDAALAFDRYFSDTDLAAAHGAAGRAAYDRIVTPWPEVCRRLVEART